MSGRPRRSEASWDKNDEKISPTDIHSNVSRDSSPKRSNSQVNDGKMNGNFSGRPMSKDDDISRDRHSYGLPYRARDRGTGGSAHMNRDQERVRDRDRDRDHDRNRDRDHDRDRDRDRTRSPYRSRSRSRSQGRTRGVTRSRSPLYNDRHESNEYDNVINNSRVSSRPYKNSRESWSRRSDYKDGLRNDDDQNQRRQSTNRNSRVPCRFFAAGSCNRSDCKFSHDIPESRDNSNMTSHAHDDLNPSKISNIPKSNFGETKKKTWDGPLWDDDKNRTLDFQDVGKSNPSLDNKNRPWNGSSWDNKNSDDNKDSCDFQDVGKSNRSLDNKNRQWNGPSWDNKNYEVVKDSCDFEDVGKCNPGLDNKNRSWNGPSWDNNNSEDNKKSCDFLDVGKSNPSLDNKKRPWNDPSRDNVNSDDNKSSRDFQDVVKSNRSLDNKNRSWNGPSWDHKNSEDNKKSCDFQDVGKSNPSLHNMNRNRPWNGPSWDNKNSDDNKNSHDFQDVRRFNSSLDNKNRSWDNKNYDDIKKSRDFQDIRKSNPSLDNKNRPWNGPSWDNKNSENNKNSCDFQDVGNRRWNGPSWDNEDDKKSCDGTSWGTMSAKSGKNIDGKTKKWNCPLWDEVSEPGYSDVGKSSGGDGTDNTIRKRDGPGFSEMSQWTSGRGLQSHTLDGQAQHVLPEISGVSSHQIHKDHNIAITVNDSNLISENKPDPLNGPKIHLNEQTENENRSRKLLEPSEIDIPQVTNDVNKTSLTSQQVYTELNLSNAIDFLKSLPHTEVNKSVKDSVSMVGKEEAVGNLEGSGNKVEEGGITISEDEKATRQFKGALVEFVKEILKPKWKEGKLSRETHKIVVKKVVDKVTSSMQGEHIPTTQPRIDQYLAYSKPKITKLVEAYVGRHVKA